ncbi:Cdc7p-Dbf4p kinase complex regulatory subunit [Coemansia sp. RSA 2618]|nr:Cdc7p-Dbf4p kinase complex regulatory subunit [Coemansia sp. RSA 2618]
MSSRKLTFDASRPSTRHLGASPAGRSTLHASNYNGDILSPARALATPTRPAQRATLARAHQAQHGSTGLASPGYSPSVSSTQSRRNPLQAITHKEQQLGNQAPAHKEPQLGNQASTHKEQQAAEAHPHTPLSANQQREQKARLAEWIYAYRRAFPSFVFYFEGIDEATVQRLAIPIRNLGAKVETFFSAQTVTHVIVGHADLVHSENAPGGSNVVSLAKRFQLKIWDVTKLEKRVLGLLLPGYNAAQNQGPTVLSAKRKLNEAFSAEKLYNMRHKTFEGASVAHCVDFYYFKYVYVLVEDATHLHRPAIMEDYRPPEDGMEPPWPKLYMVPTGRCPFVQYEDPTTSSKSSDTDAEDNKENMTPEPEHTLPTAQLLSKTPASRMCTPRRAAWTPTAARKEPESAHKPFATVAGDNSRAGAADQLLTPTRPPRNPAAGVLTAAAGRENAAQRPMHENALGIMDSNASGIVQSMGVTSTSTAFNMNAVDPVLQRSLLQNLNGGRVTHLSRLEQPVAARADSQASATRPRGKAPPIPRTKKARVPVRRPVVARPGYCENCRVKFQDMLEHVKTPQHRRFASNERNWVDLDALLDRERRPVRKAPALSSTPHLYALSSDDASQSGSTSVCSVPLHDGTSLNASGHAMHGSWGSTQYSAFASTHTPISGRMSAEATDAPARAGGVVDLTYSTNSSCASPKVAAHDHAVFGQGVQGGAAPATPVPACSIGDASNEMVSLVSSLETPQFRDARGEQPDAGATLVGAGSRKRARYSSHPPADPQHRLVTPTRPGNDRVFGDQADDLGAATLVQPARAMRAGHAKHRADTLDRPANRQDTAQRLCRMLHGDSDSGSL